MVKASCNGLNCSAASLIELGPGDSLGIGLADLLCGTDTYAELDVLPCAHRREPYSRHFNILANQGFEFRCDETVKLESKLEKSQLAKEVSRYARRGFNYKQRDYSGYQAE